MRQDIINLYDEYTHKPLSRNEFLKRLTLLTGSTAAAIAILPLIEVNAAQAAIHTSTQNLYTDFTTYPGVPDNMEAYIARPMAEKKYPAVIVIHENRGLNAHIEDVARRVAQAGYLAIAPNALAAIGAKPANDDEARTAFQTLKPENNLQNMLNLFSYLPGRTDWNGETACVGFCWGGAMANTLATKQPNLKAAVAFYGKQPPEADVLQIKAAVQLHYAGLDERINAGMQTYENALKTHSIRYEQYVYEGVNHAFHNDTASARYNQAAAKLAWERTLLFFKKHLPQ